MSVKHMPQAGWQCESTDIEACSDYKCQLQPPGQVHVQGTAINVSTCSAHSAQAVQFQLPELSTSRCSVAKCGTRPAFAGVLGLMVFEADALRSCLAHAFAEPLQGLVRVCTGNAFVWHFTHAWNSDTNGSQRWLHCCRWQRHIAGSTAARQCACARLCCCSRRSPAAEPSLRRPHVWHELCPDL